MQQFATFVVNHWDLFLALAVILALLTSGPLNRRMRGFSDIDPGTAVQMMNHQDALILDVRDESEIKGGKALGAIHIPLRSLKDRLAELDGYRERPIIVSCRTGSRSTTACGQLRKEGFATVYSLKGGMMAWQNDGLPLARAETGRKKHKRG